MKISPISFRAKIPITQCKIRDNERRKFVNATVYEIDCKDAKDVNGIINLDWDKFNFMQNITDHMKKKHRAIEHNLNVTDHYYTLETDDGDILGVCQTVNSNKKIQVKYLTSKRDGKHKYVGQNLLASLGRKLLNNNGEVIEIINPITVAERFYYKCGFRNKFNGDMIMKNKKISSFVKKSEKKTKGSIIDLNT